MRGIPAFGLLAVLTALLACTAPVAERGFRDPSAPFASISRFEIPRFLGEWVRVAEFMQSGQGITPQTVLWVDEGFRTAVLGTPSGSRAFILDRGATPAPDRLRAAREILNWYGYDLAQLEGAM